MLTISSKPQIRSSMTLSDMKFTIKADLFGIMSKVTFPLVAWRGADKGSDAAGSSATKICVASSLENSFESYRCILSRKNQ